MGCSWMVCTSVVCDDVDDPLYGGGGARRSISLLPGDSTTGAGFSGIANDCLVFAEGKGVVYADGLGEDTGVILNPPCVPAVVGVWGMSSPRCSSTCVVTFPKGSILFSCLPSSRRLLRDLRTRTAVNTMIATMATEPMTIPAMAAGCILVVCPALAPNPMLPSLEPEIVKILERKIRQRCGNREDKGPYK